MSEESDGWSKVVVKFLDIKIPNSELVMISGIVMSPREDKTNETFFITRTLFTLNTVNTFEQWINSVT